MAIAMQSSVLITRAIIRIPYRPVARVRCYLANWRVPTLLFVRARCWHANARAWRRWGLTAFEIECHVLQETLATIPHKVPADLMAHPDFGRMYSFVDQAVTETLFHDIRATTAAMNIPLDSLHVEFRGLLEAGLSPSVGVTSADRLTLYKAVVKILARRHGALASFMALLSNAHESAGGHLNLSLRDIATDEPVFHAHNAPDRLSETLRWFVGGLQRYSPELFLLYAPHLNSYKRLRLASFVPRTNTWAVDNKTVTFRVINTSPALTRIEIRVVGADINPYLALAAALAAGRRGIEQQLLPTPAAIGNALRESAASGADFPRDFARAIAHWRSSEFAHETFGTTFVEAFALSRDWQLTQFERTVTDWEIRQFAECV
jgi:glutamine synthetase